MPLEKIRRFMFALAAVALFLATVVPGMDMNANPAGSSPTMTMVGIDGMNCPDCDTSRDNMVGCAQATCLGFAVISDGGYFEASLTRPVYSKAAVARPDDFKSAPSTPPI
jgi:hypothetical protein